MASRKSHGIPILPIPRLAPRPFTKATNCHYLALGSSSCRKHCTWDFIPALMSGAVGGPLSTLAACRQHVIASLAEVPWQLTHHRPCVDKVRHQTDCSNICFRRRAKFRSVVWAETRADSPSPSPSPSCVDVGNARRMSLPGQHWLKSSRYGILF